MVYYKQLDDSPPYLPLRHIKRPTIWLCSAKSLFGVNIKGTKYRFKNICTALILIIQVTKCVICWTTDELLKWYNDLPSANGVCTGRSHNNFTCCNTSVQLFILLCKIWLIIHVTNRLSISECISNVHCFKDNNISKRSP